MLNDDIMGYMLSNAEKMSRKQAVPEVKPDISEREALDIFNEVVEVLKGHNISYQCACRILISLTDAFITGAVEMYNLEQNIPTGMQTEHL